jgi:hypothetical protein
MAPQTNTIKSAPLIVQCFNCGATLTLNEDSPAARAAGTDPHQQIRKHIFDQHTPGEIVQHHHSTAWLLDMLFFRAPLDPERWKGNIVSLLEHYLENES